METVNGDGEWRQTVNGDSAWRQGMETVNGDRQRTETEVYIERRQTGSGDR
jgi:hypothetical protein